MPLAAKIIAAPHLKADREGKLHGGGHPRRDAVEWMIPVLWPIKILTLPARGPYPALKGESRLTMRLMEDVIVPLPAPARASIPAPPRATPTNYIPSPYGLMRPASFVTREPGAPASPGAESFVSLPGRPLTVESRAIEPSATAAPPAQAPHDSQPASTSEARDDRATLVVLKGGSAFLSREYWVQGGQIQCVSEDGEKKAFPLENVDLYQTVRLNHERNVEFVLHSKNGVVEQ
jgi:hypothetical protein